MQYTFALILEKVLADLNCEPVFFHAAPLAFVNNLATYHRHNSQSSSCIYLIDNSKGTRPLSSCEQVVNGIYISSPMEFSSQKFFSAKPLSPESSQSTDLFSSPPIESYKKWIEGREDTGSLLVLPPTISRRQLEKAVLHALSYYNEWGETILQQIRTHGDWFSFIDLAHDILQNPMLIYDNSMKVLAYTRNDGTSDALWKDTVASGTAHTNSREESLELLKYIEKLEQYDKPFKHSGKGMSDPFYSCNILADNRRVGMVTVTEYNHPVTQGQLDLLWNFASLLSIQMQQEDAKKHNSNIANRQLIQDLLEGTITSHTTLTTRLVAARWDRLPMIHILQFGPAIPYISDAQWIQGLEALSALPLHGIGCLFPDQILFLCTTETAEIPPILLEAIGKTCEQYHFRCGISDAFSDLLEVSRYSSQSRLALALSSKDLCFYGDVRFANLKQHIQSYPNPDDLIHPAVLRLKQLDQETGSEYIKTLQALFENQYSQVGASLSLDIHRTTLFYRLQKIEELTGIRLHDAETMLHIQISLLLS